MEYTNSDSENKQANNAKKSYFQITSIQEDSAPKVINDPNTDNSQHHDKPQVLEHKLIPNGDISHSLCSHAVSLNKSLPRFKIVKIPSEVPYSKGRWFCNDGGFSSISTLQAQENKLNLVSFAEDDILKKEASLFAEINEISMLDEKCQTPNIINDTLYLESLNSLDSDLVLKSNVQNIINYTDLINPSIRLPGKRFAQNFLDVTGNIYEGDIKGLLNKNSYSFSTPVRDEIFEAINNQFSGSLVELASNTTQAIDNKIEQAMDLVKSHLQLAVKSEMDFLRDQVRELTEVNKSLQIENKLLRNRLHSLASVTVQKPPSTSIPQLLSVAATENKIAKVPLANHQLILSVPPPLPTTTLVNATTAASMDKTNYSTATESYNNQSIDLNSILTTVNINGRNTPIHFTNPPKATSINQGELTTDINAHFIPPPADNAQLMGNTPEGEVVTELSKLAPVSTSADPLNATRSNCFSTTTRDSPPSTSVIPVTTNTPLTLVSSIILPPQQNTLSAVIEKKPSDQHVTMKMSYDPSINPLATKSGKPLANSYDQSVLLDYKTVDTLVGPGASGDTCFHTDNAHLTKNAHLINVSINNDAQSSPLKNTLSQINGPSLHNNPNTRPFPHFSDTSRTNYTNLTTTNSNKIDVTTKVYDAISNPVMSSSTTQHSSVNIKNQNGDIGSVANNFNS